MLLTVYSSGSIPKASSDSDRAYWTDVERSAVRSGARPHDVRFLRPDDPVAELHNSMAMFGRDMYQVGLADFVIVDARERRGIGVGVEVLASRILETALIVVAPPDSHYRKQRLHFRGQTVEDYIHPHLASLADAVVPDFEAAGKWMGGYAAHPTRIRSLGRIHEAIEVYRRKVLHLDEAMTQLHLELESTAQPRMKTHADPIQDRAEGSAEGNSY